MRMTGTLLIIAMCSLLAFDAHAGTTTEDAADFLVSRGEQELNGGELRSAIQSFSKALMLDPDNLRAKNYLAQLHIDEGPYTMNRTRNDQIADMARDIREYQQEVMALKHERARLWDRVGALEDAMIRKGDHPVVQDVDEYYRRVAYYDVDDRLDRSEQLAMIDHRHEKIREMSRDRDRQYEKMFHVMGQVLEYREDHLEDARNDIIGYQIAMSQNRRDLHAKMERLRKLQSEYDKIGRDQRTADKIRALESEIIRTKQEIQLLERQRKATRLNLEQDSSRVDKL